MLYFISHLVGKRPAIKISVGNFLAFDYTIGSVNFYLLSALTLYFKIISAGTAYSEIKYESAFTPPYFYRFSIIIRLYGLCSANLFFT